jgi:hypothetical protein
VGRSFGRAGQIPGRGEPTRGGAAGAARCRFASRSPSGCETSERAQARASRAGSKASDRGFGEVDARPTQEARRDRAGVWHNATPEEDHRTALLSDGPHAGVRYASPAGVKRNRSGREAGSRYSAGRAQRGRGRFLRLGGKESPPDSNEGLLAGPRQNGEAIGCVTRRENKTTHKRVTTVAVGYCSRQIGSALKYLRKFCQTPGYRVWLR